MADIVGFGSKGLGGKKAVASIDVDKMAESMGVSEEIVSQNVLAIEAIWATEGKGKGWKTRQTQYILGIKPRPAAKLTKEEKAAKKRADQAAERQKLLDMGVNVSVVPGFIANSCVDTGSSPNTLYVPSSPPSSSGTACWSKSA